MKHLIITRKYTAVLGYSSLSTFPDNNTSSISVKNTYGPDLSLALSRSVGRVGENPGNEVAVKVNSSRRERSTFVAIKQYNSFVLLPAQTLWVRNRSSVRCYVSPK